MTERFPSLHVIRHSLAEHKLTYMRDTACSTSRFRQLVREVGLMLTIEATRDLPLAPVTVETENLPGKPINSRVLAGNNAVIVAILRAGLVMAEGALEVMPNAKIGHIGLYRKPDTYEVEEYLVSLPDPLSRMFIIMDTVVGTGNSACKAISILKNDVAVDDSNIRLITVLVSPEGMENINEKYPLVKVYAASLENELDDDNHIVPGFGHASARLFGTEN